jgi:hypothetical protein
MKTIYALGIGIAGISAMVAVAAHGQMDTTASSKGAKVEAVVDANGNLHVPDAYRTTYQSLGSWAVATDEGEGPKELHVVYTSPGTITAYRKNGRFPEGAVLVKEVFRAATGQMTTGTVSRADTLKGWFVMMKDSNVAMPAISCGVTAGVGRGSMLPTRRRQRRPTTKRIVYHVTCQRKLPIGFMSVATRR